MSRRSSLIPSSHFQESTPEALGQSEVFLDFQSQVSQVAKVDRPILVVGERGTGKELVASRLHFLSKRWQGPLVTLNCAALTPSLLETELFGHEAGAYTGAAHRRQGRFEAASGGTLFLDEIGLIPLQVQEKILRAVEYRAFERVGSSESIQIDVRIIAATNADLPKMARLGKFLPDLLDRLSFEVLNVPPLRYREGDILLLAMHFAGKMARELGRNETIEFSEAATRQLFAHPWPGNVRELKNVVERALYRTSGPIIQALDFNPFQNPYQTLTPPSDDPQNTLSAKSNPSPESNAGFEIGTMSFTEALENFERKAVETALEKARFHQGEAASLLRLTYHQFRALYRKHQKNLTPPPGI